MASKKMFRDYIRDARISSGLSQGDVASKLGYSTPQFISNWERGVSMPPIDSLKTIAKMYQISPEELFETMEAEIVKDLKLSLHKKFKTA
ncbi:helix-turn-helix domain-containing protein [Bdellovibrio svalbardensis]|uniref:Helix-turn-helix domain-containing protein n=1 Tax=Bdellovibrio svalbardensis TaxID=2972972 RepID=A0ABT6DI45_9BACT|nr:helix-turn-helix transcriptional regulator [Bdellovibrio svalbardensis]MDG0816456.1 helix-turn-helix domain-containing protein [Bdellovibrio svalbardensis]